MIPQQPRKAALAAAPSAKQYQQALTRTRKSVARRRRLPLTQQEFKAQQRT